MGDSKKGSGVVGKLIVLVLFVALVGAAAYILFFWHRTSDQSMSVPVYSWGTYSFKGNQEKASVSNQTAFMAWLLTESASQSVASASNNSAKMALANSSNLGPAPGSGQGCYEMTLPSDAKGSDGYVVLIFNGNGAPIDVSIKFTGHLLKIW